MSAVPAVRRMVMFKHGVAYLERAGPADGPFELWFRKEEMNDVLKSLAVWVERGEAQVGAIAFDKPEDPELALAERKLNLAPGAALSGLIGSFRGRRVVIDAGGERHQGEIVGLEAEPLEGGGTRRTVLLRTGDASIALVDLSLAKSMDFVDESSCADLSFLLERSRAATAGSRRSVRVPIAGAAEELRVSYVIPAPAWRVTYRVACDEDSATLMAWGIVHNPADEDLDDLELTLTSGQPVSFTIDLYNPKNVRRAALEESARVAAAPRALETDIGDMLSSTLSADEDVETGSLSASRMSRAARHLTGATDYADRGELFEYRVASRVSLRRGGSAMVPLLATRIEARKQRLWRVGASAPHPDLVLAFRNATGAVLEEGAAVVYDQSVYAGEAMLAYSARDVDVRLGFARDLAVRCKHASETREVTTAIRLAPDAAVEERRLEAHHELVAESDHAAEIELVFELERIAGRSFDPEHAQPDTDTLNYHRFRVNVPPHGRATLKVVERWPGQQRYLYTAFSATDLQRWLEGRFLDQSVWKELGGVLAARDRIRMLQQQVERAAKDQEAAYAKQKKLSEQLTVLKEGGKEGELRLRYVGELEAEQDKANRLGEEVARLKSEIEACNREGNDRLRGIIGAPARGRYDALIARGVLLPEELELAARHARRRGLDIETVLIDEFQVKVAALGEALEKFFGVPYEPFRPDRARPGDLLRHLKRDYAASSGWVPLEETREGMVVLTTDPEQVMSSGVVGKVFPKMKALYRVCTAREFAATLNQLFSGGK